MGKCKDMVDSRLHGEVVSTVVHNVNVNAGIKWPPRQGRSRGGRDLRFAASAKC